MTEDDRSRAAEAMPPLGSKVAFLSSPNSYPGVEEVELRETRMAWVFLAGDRVYKMKKPVRQPPLDYATLDARRRVCVDEDRLNRRLAPGVYLGLGRLTVEADGRLAIDGEGETVEWLVVMRRLPEELMLDQAIRARSVTPDAIDAVARRLTRFYRGLTPCGRAPGAQAEGFLRELAANARVFDVKAFSAVADRGAAMSRRLQALLQRRPDLLAERAGRIVEGHGDLRPEHICLTAPPVVIDCLEFSRELRLVDPFDELCYLGMECAVLGAPWIAAPLIARASRDLRDAPPDAVLAFYTAYRATFRARQALAHLMEPHPRTPEKWLPLADLYLEQAEAAALRLPPR